VLTSVLVIGRLVTCVLVFGVLVVGVLVIGNYCIGILFSRIIILNLTQNKKYSQVDTSYFQSIFSKKKSLHQLVKALIQTILLFNHLFL
jgi:hypothetical protein